MNSNQELSLFPSNKRSECENNQYPAIADDCFQGISEMPNKEEKPTRKRRNFWNNELCSQEAKRYESRSQFSFGSPSAYQVARANNWLDKICSHMVKTTLPKGYWTKEKCQEEALKYTTRTKYMNGNGSSYRAALTHKWLDDICSHMESKAKRIGTKSGVEFLIQATDNDETSRSLYGVVTEDNMSFINSTAEYYNLHDYLADLQATTTDFTSMKTYSNPIQQLCWIEASKCLSKDEFELCCPSIYEFCKEKHWLTDLCAHMDEWP